MERSQFGRWNSLKRSEEHTSELQSRLHLVCRLLLEKKKITTHCRSTSSSLNDNSKSLTLIATPTDPIILCSDIVPLLNTVSTRNPSVHSLFYSLTL